MKVPCDSFLCLIVQEVKSLLSLIKKKIKRKKNERAKAQKEYDESCQYIYNIYLNLNESERNIFYRLFHEKEVIIPHSDFQEEEYCHTKEFVNMVYFKDEEDLRYGNKSDYNIFCERNEYYTNGSNSLSDWSYGWKSYKFTMEPSFRDYYSDIIEKVKKIIDENLI